MKKPSRQPRQTTPAYRAGLALVVDYVGERLEVQNILRALWVFTVVAVLVVASFPRVVSAEISCNLEMIFKDTPYYNPCLIDTGSTCTVSTDLVGASNEEKIWNYFSGKGLSPIAVAGIMGNFIQETSTYDPAGKQDGTLKAIPDKGDGETGFGVAQWTSQNRQALLFTEIRNAGLQKYYGAGWGHPEENKAIPAEDIEKLLSIELNFAWGADTTKIQDIANQLNGAPSVEGDSGSTVLFHKLYERSDDTAAQIKERINSANTILGKYGKTGVLASGSCSTGQLGGVSNMQDVLPWAMKFIEDTATEYNGAPKATATLLNKPTWGGDLVSIATFPDASSEFPCWGAWGCDECTTLSGWFVTKMTGYTYGGGDGGEVVDFLRAKGVPTGATPKPFSIFSYDTGEFGHTGVVMGVLGDGTLITLENNWPTDTLSIRKYNLKADYPRAEFAYVADKLVVKGIPGAAQ